MTPRSHFDPLDSAERRLADALSQAAPLPGPSASVEAAILAAARDAAMVRTTGEPPSAPQPTTAAGHRRRRRNPAWLRGSAVAATLVIAVGVAWQLRPQFDAQEFEVDAPPAAATAIATVPGDPDAGATPAPPPRRRAGQAAPPTLRSRAAPPGDAMEAAAEKARAEDRSAARSRSADPLRHAAPRPAPAPSPPPAPTQAPALQAATPPPRAATPEADARLRAASADDAHVADPPGSDPGEDWVDQPLDNIPPASVASPAVREAWLARIRELVASERYAEARDSFAEFQRRHPDAPVPEDLRALLGEE